MKNRLLYKVLPLLLLVFTMFSCEDEMEKLSSDFEVPYVFVYQPNPATGLPFTPEELKELRFDPRYKMEYIEGQMIDLSLIMSRAAFQVEFLDVDGNLLKTYTESDFIKHGESQFITPSFSSTLEEVGLLEKNDKTAFSYKAYYKSSEGITCMNTTYSLKRVVPVNPDEIINTFVYLIKKSGESVPLRIEEEVVSRVKDPLYGHVVEFDAAANNKVKVIDNDAISFRYSQNYSIGFWMNTAETISGDPVLIGDQNWASSGNMGMTSAIKNDTWRTVINDTEGVKGDTRTSFPINDGNWHFLVMTFDRQGSMNTYVDGTLAESTSIAGLATTDNGNSLHIGQDGEGDYGDWYGGKFGNVYIYDYALSADEVKNASELTGVQLKKQSGALINLPVTNHNGAGESVEEGRITFDFQGGTYVEILDPLEFRNENDFSFSFWTKYSDMPSDPCFMGDKDWGSGGNPGFCVFYGSGSIRVNSAGQGGGRVDNSSDQAYNDDQWHKVVVVVNRNEGTQSLWVDGTLGNVLDISDQGNRESGMPWNIGNEGTGSYTDFIGKVAETVIYDYALTAEEVEKLFE